MKIITINPSKQKPTTKKKKEKMVWWEIKGLFLHNLEKKDYNCLTDGRGNAKI